MRHCLYTTCAALLVLIGGAAILVAIAAALWDMLHTIPLALMLVLSVVGVMAALIDHEREEP